MEAIIKELNTCGDWVVACRHWLELRRLVGWGLSPDVEVRFGVESHSVVFISALPSTPPRHPRLVSYIQSVARVSRPLIALQNDLHALVAHPLLSAVLPRPLPPVQLHHVHAPPRPRHSTAQHAPAAFPPDRPYSLLVSLILPVSAPTPAAALVSSPPPPPRDPTPSALLLPKPCPFHHPIQVESALPPSSAALATRAERRPASMTPQMVLVLQPTRTNPSQSRPGALGEIILSRIYSPPHYLPLARVPSVAVLK